VRIFWLGPTWARLFHRFINANSHKFDAFTPEPTSTQTGSERIRNRPDTAKGTRNRKLILWAKFTHWMASRHIEYTHDEAGACRSQT
jgi:hypothetical protein